jgi:hypothetical protein
VSNHIALPANVGEQIDGRTQESKPDEDASSVDEDGTTHEGEATGKHQNCETKCLDSVVSLLSERDELEFEKEQHKVEVILV